MSPIESTTTVTPSPEHQIEPQTGRFHQITANSYTPQCLVRVASASRPGGMTVENCRLCLAGSWLCNRHRAGNVAHPYVPCYRQAASRAP